MQGQHAVCPGGRERVDVLKTSTLSRRLHTKIAIALLTLGLTLNNCATITLSKPGYKTVTTSGMSSISGGGGTAMAGNLLLGGIIGAGVDASNGAMNELAPNPLHVVMEGEAGNQAVEHISLAQASKDIARALTNRVEGSVDRANLLWVFDKKKRSFCPLRRGMTGQPNSMEILRP